MRAFTMFASERDAYAAAAIRDIERYYDYAPREMP